MYIYIYIYNQKKSKHNQINPYIYKASSAPNHGATTATGNTGRGGRVSYMRGDRLVGATLSTPNLGLARA